MGFVQWYCHTSGPATILVHDLFRQRISAGRAAGKLGNWPSPPHWRPIINDVGIEAAVCGGGYSMETKAHLYGIKLLRSLPRTVGRFSLDSCLVQSLKRTYIFFASWWKPTLVVICSDSPQTHQKHAIDLVGPKEVVSKPSIRMGCARCIYPYVSYIHTSSHHLFQHNSLCLHGGRIHCGSKSLSWSAHPGGWVPSDAPAGLVVFSLDTSPRQAREVLLMAVAA